MLLQFAVLSVLGGAVIFLSWCATRRRLRLPPGPKGLPLVGNWFQLPAAQSWETYNRWAELYGDIVHVKDFNRHVFILNSLKTVEDMLEKRSNIYSSRPQFIMFHQLMNFGNATTFLPYGDTWRKHRTLFNQQMHKGAIDQFQRLQYEGVRELLRNILESPGQIQKHLHYFTGGIILRFSYGYKLQAKDDPVYGLLVMNHRGTAFARATTPGAFLVDNVPILRYIPTWFPGAEFKRFAAETRRRLDHSREVLFQRVKSELRAGIAPPSFVANALAELGTDDEDDENVDAIKEVARVFLAAGTGTTAMTLSVFILAMAVYPECMKKAQMEIDAVVGRSRLPEFNDRPNLPYINPILKETMRWIPTLPAALPHATTADDVYEGYSIPKGSLVIPNVWKIMRDPEIYPDPLTFRPERFLCEENKGVCEPDPSVTGAFGYGRRICAGKNLADATLWIAMTTLLWAFDFSNPRDKDGKTLDRLRAAKPVRGALFLNPDYSVEVRPRSKEVEALIHRSVDV